MRSSTNSRSVSFGLVLIAVLFGGCRRQVVAPVAAPGAIVQARTFVDLSAGWRLTVIAPIGETGNVNNAQTNGLNVTIHLDPQKKFGFERTEYAITEKGLAWQKSTRTIDGKEESASGPMVPLFSKPGKKQALRLLFLTRVSDQNYNTALLSACDLKALDQLMTVVRANPENACNAPTCIWMPPRVAARPEKPGPNGFVPVL